MVNSALRKLNINHKLEIIGNPNLFSDYKVSNPPALIINGEILVKGYIPTQEEMIKILSNKK
ncbi:thioredoxin family protein [Schnuerera sp.]|uniref:thioredoxin family protein n=1 Tax=Schnuerera sp. TaxID=2794844 RepID=UPI002D7FB7A3|nr:thioredoxin family protein [Schnuerera sp.]